MKIKKSELLALIKEEIMDEMRGLTMMDDPYDDDDDMGMMQEGVEALTDPATAQLLADVAVKLAPLATFVGLPVLIKALVDEIKDARKKRGEM